MASSIEVEKRTHKLHPIRVGVALLKSMRLSQWTKNVVVAFPFAFTAGVTWDTSDPSDAIPLLMRSLSGVLVFCILSSTVYLVNDIADRERDKKHPRKSRRPIASGALPVPFAVAAAALFLLIGIGWALALDYRFALLGTLYLVLNLAYSFHLKHVVLLDTMVVASGYVIRLFSGSVLVDVDTSAWLYLTVGLGALLLVLGKRHSEMLNAGGESVEQRAVLSQYTESLVRQLITVTATCTLLAYGLYIFVADNLPDNEYMFLTLPFVLFGLFRFLYLIERSEVAESPEQLILKDIPLLATTVLWALTAITILTWFRDA